MKDKLTIKDRIKVTILAIVIIILTGLASAHAQRKLSVSIHQDAKFAFIGDKERGYDAGTINILTRFKMQGHQLETGYMVVFPEFEYADIEGIYKRYSANVGFTFNKLIVNNFEATSYIGYGWIDRYGKTMFSFGGGGELSYNIGDFKLSLVAQLTERSDLNQIRFSGFFGIEYNL